MHRLYAEVRNEGNAMNDSRFMTAKQVAGLFEVSTSTVLRWAKDGRLPALVTPSGRMRFPRESIEELFSVNQHVVQKRGGTS
jgi:excisionase family DNA binding protein